MVNLMANGGQCSTSAAALAWTLNAAVAALASQSTLLLKLHAFAHMLVVTVCCTNVCLG